MQKFKSLFKIFAAFLLGFTLSANAELVINGSFEHDENSDGIPDGWNKDSSYEAAGEYSIVTEDGRKAQKLQRSTANGAIFRISQNHITAVPDANYIFSAYVKSNGNAAIFLYEFLKDSTYKTHNIKIDKKNKDWQKVTHLITTRKDCIEFKISVIATQQKVGNPVFFSNVSLEALDEAPNAVAMQLPKEPALNADWNDPAWEKATNAGTFTKLGNTLALPSAPTNAKFAMYGKTLHVIMKCAEPKMNETVANSANWTDDSAELFLRSQFTDAIYQFGVTQQGKGLYNIIKDQQNGFYKDWYSSKTTTSNDNEQVVFDFKSAAKKDKDSWTAQFAVTVPDSFFKGMKQCEILFARSRKLKNLEENSSWGRTESDFFKFSTCFANIALQPKTDARSTSKPIAALPLPKPGQRLIPNPQKAILSNSYFILPKPLKVYAGKGAEKAFKAMGLIFKNQLAVDVISANEKEANVILTLNTNPKWKGYGKLNDWQKQESYTLSTAKVVKAEAPTHRALVFALQTFAQLCANNEAGQLACRQAEIFDWPDMQYRGWHCTAPNTSQEMPDALRVIDFLATMKFNWFSIQFDNRFKYERHPGLARSDAPTKAEHKLLAERMDLYGMEVIPMTQCFSHFNYFLSLPEFRKFAEVQNPNEKSRHKYWNYCPRHPEIHKIIFDMIEEHLECYPNAKWYHAGLDEITFEPIAVCERCKGATGGTLLAEEIDRLHKFISSKGLRMCMWGDQLLVEHNGKGKFNTAEALPKVPRDVVIFDWHYGETKDFPSVAFFKDKGFDVIPSGWYFPGNVVPLIQETLRQKVIGYGGTTWMPISSIHTSFHLMTSLILCGDRTWHKDDTPIENIPYLPVEEFQKIYDGASAMVPKEFKTIDISPWCNMSLKGEGNTPWMGLDADNDASALKTGLGWFANIPFSISAANKAAICLASQKDTSNTIPASAWQIPVLGKATALSFLHTTSVPDKYMRTMYDRNKVNPKTVAKYIIHYEDGSQITIPLVWSQNIKCWNSQFGSGKTKVGWRGTTKAGAFISLEVFTWNNPKPDIPITALDFVTCRDKVNPVLLGVTAITK